MMAFIIIAYHLLIFSTACVTAAAKTEQAVLLALERSRHVKVITTMKGAMTVNVSVCVKDRSFLSGIAQPLFVQTRRLGQYNFLFLHPLLIHSYNKAGTCYLSQLFLFSSVKTFLLFSVKGKKLFFCMAKRDNDEDATCRDAEKMPRERSSASIFYAFFLSFPFCRAAAAMPLLLQHTQWTNVEYVPPKRNQRLKNTILRFIIVTWSREAV